MAELVATFLEREDDRFAIETATSVDEGLSWLAANDVDCIISDYDMPDRTGIEFLEAVRTEYPDLPFILYTGKGSEEVASDAISAGVTEYLQKESGTSQYMVLAHRMRNAVERYHSRHAVEETEQKLSQIAEKTDDVLFMYDGDWSELLFVNSAFEEIFDASVRDLRDRPRSFLDHVHPEDRSTVEQFMTRIQDGTSETLEFRIGTGEGDYRWVRGEGRPIFDDEEHVRRITGFVRDITERKLRAEDLRARATAMDAATDGISILDEDQEYVFMNESHANIYGFDDPERLYGETWRVCYATESIARFEEDILPDLFERGQWTGEMTVTAADGRTFHQDLTLTRLDNGRVVCVVRVLT